MNKIEILKNILAARGVTLCLGRQRNLFSSIENVLDYIPENEQRLLYIPTDSIIKPLITDIHINGYKWMVVVSPSVHHISRNVAYISIDDFFSYLTKFDRCDSSSQIHESNNVTAFKNFIATLSLNNVWMLDGFPYQSHEFVSDLNKMVELCDGANIAFGVAIISGISKFGSTDISTEEDAVQEAIEGIKRKNIPFMVVHKELVCDQVSSFYSPRFFRLDNRLRVFQDDCAKTKENLQIAKDIFPMTLTIGANMSEQEYVNFVKTKLKEFEPMLPVVKYLDDRFYDNFKSRIRHIFNNHNDAELTKSTNECYMELNKLLLQWIN